MAESPEKLAYTLGAMYGDGCFSHKDQNGRVHFGSTDKEFIEKVVSEINSLFDLNLKIRTDKLSKKNRKWKDFYSFSSRRLYKKISDFDFKITRSIPDFIVNGSRDVKVSFIRGFFDAEGSVNIQRIKREKGNLEIQRHISCFSNDTELLNQVLLLLSDLDIKAKIFHNKNNTFYISVWNYNSLKKFYDMIGFSIQRKMKILESALESYKLIQTRWDYKTYETVIAFRKRGMGPREIKRNLSYSKIEISVPTIESWIYKNNKPLNRR